MPDIAHSQNTLVSNDAKKHIARLQPFATLDVWMNPVTRGLARKLGAGELEKARAEIDFEYRLSDCEIGDVACVRYETANTVCDDRAILYIHGGLLMSGTAALNASIALPSCKSTNIQGYGVDYTKLPDARFPVQLDELSAVYDALLNEHEKKRIILLADGIGGSLALAAMMRWRDAGKKLPVAAVFLSGIFDGKGLSDTLKSLRDDDPRVRTHGGRDCRKLFSYYAPDQKLDDPAVSPVYGAFAGLPPLLAHVGSREALLGDTARMMEAARRAGVETHLRIFDGMVHQFHLHWHLPEARAAHEDIGLFISKIAPPTIF